MPADLHIHTNFSDGTETPEKIIELAKEAALTALSLTDHDTIDGIERGMAAGAEFGIEVIPGVELSTLLDFTEMHILGYFIDYKKPELLGTLRGKQEKRKKRIVQIVEKLRSLKVKIDPNEVFAIAGNESPGRPHVARALINAGVVADLREAFQRFLADNAPAFVPHSKLNPKDAIAIIKNAGGIAVLAHPGVYGLERYIPDLAVWGLRGIEVYYPTHSEDTVKKYHEIANKHGLLMTGGTDYHGKNSGREIKIGATVIDDQNLEKFRNEHLRGN